MSDRHSPPLGPLAAAFVAGIGSAIQAKANGALGDRLDDGLLAAFISISIGLVVLLLAVASSRRLRAGIHVLRGHVVGRRLQWWQLLGGLGGAMFVVAQSVTVATIGVALFTVCTVSGLTSGGAAVDRAGLSPGGKRPVTWPRVLAGVLCVLAVALAVSGAGSGTLVPAFVAFALLAGLAGAVQGAVNAQVTVASGSALVSTLVNFVVAWLAVLVVVGVDHALRREGFAAPPTPWDEPFLWTGGLLGLAFVIVLSATVGPLGVLVFSLAATAGGLAGALVIDALAPDAPPITAALVTGVLLTFVAVALAGLPPRRRRGVGVGQDDSS